MVPRIRTRRQGSRQASGEHFQQCTEFPLLRNRDLGPLVVTVLPIPLPGEPPLPLALLCNRSPFFVAGEAGTSWARNVSGYLRHAAERTDTIACSRGGAGRTPRSEVSKARDRSGPGSVRSTR
jgi:hypothetical protein